MKRVEFEVPGDPSGGRINGRPAMRGRGPNKTIGKSKEYKAYMARVARAAREAVRSSGVSFRGGVFAFAFTAYYRRRVDPKNKTRKVPLPDVPEGLAATDVDAIDKCVLDGLAEGGLIDNDIRAIEMHVRKRVDAKNPRVMVAVWEASLTDG